MANVEKSPDVKQSEAAASLLPLPSVAPAPARKSTGKRIAITLLALAALWTILPTLAPSTDTALPYDPYLQGVSDKGFRMALGPKSHNYKEHKHKDHKHKDHKHKDHKHKGHHGHKDEPHHPGHHKHDRHRPPGTPIPPHKAEEIFLGVPTNQSAHDVLQKYTSVPHYAGNGFDKVTALALKNDWEYALGLHPSGADDHIYDAGTQHSQERVRGKPKLGVWIDTYYPVLNTPVHASVTLLTPEPFKAKLQEDIVDGDPDSHFRDALPVFHGLSVSGDVTAQYVYAGYGLKSDFDALEANGIDVSGKLAVVRYGGNFRGLKVKAAEEAGAVGVIIYSDPADDGDITEENGYKPYPEGPARQPSSVQRGSVQYLSKYPGDPSTPGYPAYKNATRVEGGNQPSIPSLPLSYEDAIPILKALQGQGRKAEEISDRWVGGLGYKGVDYWTGPSEVSLHLVNEVNTAVTPVWNVGAVIPGHIEDEVIIVGNHRDAWVLGAGDPNSGTAAQMEAIRGIGKLVKSGWKPMRTIIFASWDAEEYGLIGSTEWAEDFGDWLKENTVAYLNLDSAVAGSIYHASASPSLAWLLRQAAQDVKAASPSASIASEAMEEEGLSVNEWSYTANQTLTMAEKETRVRPLGSGSDYTAFLQRYGIASSDFGYARGGKDAVYHYHSIYDSFTWQEKYSDPGFHKHVEIAKILGLTTLRLADSLVLPLNTTTYTHELKDYLVKIEDLLDELNFTGQVNLESLRQSISTAISASEELDAKVERTLSRLRKLLPKRPHRSLMGKLTRHLAFLEHGCHGAARNMEVWSEDSEQFPSVRPLHFPPVKNHKAIEKLLKEIRVINKKKQGFEGGFISEDGIKDREWYKHKGVAPGLWLGYGATTFPALTEALTITKSPALAQKEANELGELIEKIAERLRA
ncbi:hypothetical protein DB88DRAFT_492893 [Papiliotrema laurentii]|uniref:Zn-dependent exopeptidase n=1 Tax=Papiliotrema laurentii TaxID=5418 RepID=A0AAD9FKP0_PAPLA|nr:hypothetical protein DB88DRAFT_492893 [Papiliotrema laurentii]